MDSIEFVGQPNPARTKNEISQPEPVLTTQTHIVALNRNFFYWVNQSTRKKQPKIDIPTQEWNHP